MFSLHPSLAQKITPVQFPLATINTCKCKIPISSSSQPKKFPNCEIPFSISLQHRQSLLSVKLTFYCSPQLQKPSFCMTTDFPALPSPKNYPKCKIPLSSSLQSQKSPLSVKSSCPAIVHPKHHL